MATRSPDALKNLRGANKEARGRYLGDVASRERAANILNPTEVSGEYDAGRMLSTTLGGQLRSLTHEDLATFRQNVKTAGKQFKGGITAKAIIDMSLAIDRERANAEIRSAVPIQWLGGRVHFLTNSGPNSDVRRHHVHIELLNFSAAVASPSKLPEMAKFLGQGPLKFDCDCERHTYWFRYLATVGQFNSGRRETGFPKIRNPQLTGVACKHVLRVMQALNTPSIRLQLETMIKKARGEVQGSSKLLTSAEAREIAEQQAREAHWKRNQVESSSDKRLRLAKAKSIQALAQRSKAPKPKASAAVTAQTKRQFLTQARVLATAGVITDKQLQSLMSKMK